ncbi:MAG: hypothetical protein IPM82_12825 [Saprospiraceae bacterium]|nr:hypothetical protein [Saprospiraceae bacterium]
MNKKKPLSKPGFDFNIFHHVGDLPKDWVAAAPDDNTFLHIPYLSALEDAPPIGMKFSYLIFYQNHQPIGVAYCQVTPFSVGESIQSSDEKDRYPCLVRAFGRIVRNLVAGKNRNLLVCGNLLLTGEHGFHFPASIDKATAFDLLEEALILTQAELESKDINIDGIFIKDIAEEHRAPMKVLVDRKFKEFTFHPNMVLQLRENWLTFEDYMDDISSKYKVRARKAFKCLDGIEKKELTDNQIFSFQDRFYELYKSVVDNQDFNMVSLNEKYLPNLKRQLGDNFKVYGYFLNDELIGYFTTITNYHELEAHFLGFEAGLNREYHLYHNMLFDILKLGIENKMKKVVYARTAMEIKSTLGAEAHEMLCYIRANNRLTNKVLPPIVEYLKPASDWVARNPFKG